MRDGRNVRRACYVNIGQAFLGVFRAWQGGAYPRHNRRRHRWLFVRRKIRLGAYGDPAAVPFRVWAPLIELVDSWTAYSHAWRTCDPSFRQIVMASVGSPADASAAHAQGWRTFRTAPRGALPMASEVGCPAAEENGKRTTCDACCLCKWASVRAKSVRIWAHGSPPVMANYAKRFGR